MELFFNDYLALSMLATFIILIFSGIPVAWVLGGVSILYSFICVLILKYTDLMADSWFIVDWAFTSAIVERIWSVMENWVLIALPLFIFMGLCLDKSGVAHELMTNFSRLLGRIRGGLALAVAFIGIILAASTGIIGASVVLLGLLGLPVMLENKYEKSFAVGTVCAVGTLGILIPPSIMLVLMADRLALSVGDLFMGAMIPGFILGLTYVVFILVFAFIKKDSAPATHKEPIGFSDVLSIVLSMLPPLLLIFAVLGSVFFGIATPTEAAGIGALSTVIMAYIKGKLSFKVMHQVTQSTMTTTGFIFALVIGATAFAFIFRGLGGDELIENFLMSLPLGINGILISVLIMTFILGFFLDWIEITLILLPLVGPPLGAMGVDLVWFGILFAVCLQTSFITPPVGPALFYIQGVTPPNVRLQDVYKGIIPYVILQILVLCLIFNVPSLVTWLPSVAY